MHAQYGSQRSDGLPCGRHALLMLGVLRPNVEVERRPMAVRSNEGLGVGAVNIRPLCWIEPTHARDKPLLELGILAYVRRVVPDGTRNIAPKGTEVNMNTMCVCRIPRRIAH